MKMKKFIAMMATVAMVAGLAVGCGGGSDAEGGEGGEKANDGNADGDDAVLAEREDGTADERDGAGHGRWIRVDVETKMMRKMNGLSHLCNVCLKG